MKFIIGGEQSLDCKSVSFYGSKASDELIRCNSETDGKVRMGEDTNFWLTEILTAPRKPEVVFLWKNIC